MNIGRVGSTFTYRRFSRTAQLKEICLESVQEVCRTPCAWDSIKMWAVCNKCISNTKLLGRTPDGSEVALILTEDRLWINCVCVFVCVCVCVCSKSGLVLHVAGIVGVASSLHTRDHISKQSEKHHQEKFQTVKSPSSDIRHC